MQAMTDRFDWPGLLRLGLLQLGLLPADFWALTPRELNMMLGHSDQIRPLDRDGMAALLQKYPDPERNTG